VHHRGSNKKEWLLTLLNLAPTNFWLVRDFFEKNHQILWWFQFFFVPLWWETGIPGGQLAFTAWNPLNIF
jgi:hypothetical protein